MSTLGTVGTKMPNSKTQKGHVHADQDKYGNNICKYDNIFDIDAQPKSVEEVMHDSSYEIITQHSCRYWKKVTTYKVCVSIRNVVSFLGK